VCSQVRRVKKSEVRTSQVPEIAFCAEVAAQLARGNRSGEIFEFRRRRYEDGNTDEKVSGVIHFIIAYVQSPAEDYMTICSKAS
jgi:hypothetical protein